ncbi:MAG: Rpn family recombination-promoting nuclease/putative transposase [Bacteroidota bacterium]
MTHDQPHDRLLKETLSHIEEAILFFKKFLPQ